MFEIGKKYDVIMLESSENGTGPFEIYGLRVSEIEGALVKFVTDPVQINIGEEIQHQMPSTERIINTGSLYFVSAKPSGEG